MHGQNEVLDLTRMLRPMRCDWRMRRIGTLGDGGYVLPDDLQGIRSVLSIGVGSEVSFDLHFAECGTPVFQYDHTVDCPPAAHAGFHFHREAWGRSDADGVVSLGTMMERHGLTNATDALLKFDVEGAEWEILRPDDSGLLQRFRLVVCELHGLHNLHVPAFRSDYRSVMQTLLANHTVVHLHANNCCGVTLIAGIPVPAVVELTLLRNDRSCFSLSTDPIPGPLDYPSMPDRADIVLTAYS
jgi:hypothetical protein